MSDSQRGVSNIDHPKHQPHQSYLAQGTSKFIYSQNNRTKQSIEIEDFFDWIVSTQCKSGGGNEVADYKKSDLSSRYHSSLKNGPIYIK